MTKVINLIGAPGVGKSTLMAMIFVELKKRNYSCEMVHEWVKTLVWQNKLDIIQNQHYIIQQQYDSIKCLDNKVDYIILDTSLVNYIYYNRTDANNICNVEKTEAFAKRLMAEFDNVFIFVKRNYDNYYETKGRLHTFEQSEQIECDLKLLIEELKLDIITFNSSSENCKIQELIKNFL